MVIISRILITFFLDYILLINLGLDVLAEQ